MVTLPAVDEINHPPTLYIFTGIDQIPAILCPLHFERLIADLIRPGFPYLCGLLFKRARRSMLRP